MPAQHRVLMPENRHIGCRLVAAEQHDEQAEYPAGQHVDDLEQHPGSQPSPRPACRRRCRSTTQIEYSSGTRPHRSLQLRPPRPDHPVVGLSHERIKRRPVLGGLINEYEQTA